MKKILKFIVSGGTAAASKLVIFIILFSFFKMWYLLASVIAFLCSIAVGFYLQKYITFESFSREQIKKQAALFFGVSMLNLLVNIISMYGFVQLLKFEEIIAQIITIGIIACWNFFVYQKFVFANKKNLPIG